MIKKIDNDNKLIKLKKIITITKKIKKKVKQYCLILNSLNTEGKN